MEAMGEEEADVRRSDCSDWPGSVLSNSLVFMADGGVS